MRFTNPVVFLIKVLRDLPFSGVKRRLVTGVKDILETVRVTSTNFRIQHLEHALS